MEPHGFFLVCVVYPLSINAIVWPVAWFKMRRGSITARQRRFPKWRYAVVAMLGTAQNLLSTWPASHLSGAVQTLIGTGIPETMLLSVVLVGARYRPRHVLGAVVIVVGLLVVVWPDMLHTPASHGGGNFWFWAAMYVSANFLPKTVFDEKWTKEWDMDLWYYRAWDGLFEILAGWLLLFTVLIRLPDHPHVSVAGLPAYLGDSATCFFRGTGNDGRCEGAWQLWLVFIVVNVGYNITQLAVAKYASAVTIAAASAVVVPISTLLFQVVWIAGSATQHGMSLYTWGGMVGVVAGIGVYRSAKEMSNLPRRSVRGWGKGKDRPG